MPTFWGGRIEPAIKPWTLVVVMVFCLAASELSAAKDTKDLYSEKCASCHSADGSGHTAATAKMKVPDLRSKRVKQMSDEDLYVATAEGKGHEEYPHGFLHIGLTEQQIRDLIKYIRTLQENPKSVRH
jgi:mono/diheme cytochrome c family protein